jgi:hypothetical protein
MNPEATSKKNSAKNQNVVKYGQERNLEGIEGMEKEIMRA